MRSQVDVDRITTTVQRRVQDKVLTAIKSLVIPWEELALKSTNATWGRNVDGNVLALDKRDFSGQIEGLQKTASSKTDSHTDLNTVQWDSVLILP